MARSNMQRRMVLLAIALSLLLTALTVWAVDRQGAALLERERADLQNAARAAAAQTTAEFRENLQRALDAAQGAQERAGDDGLDEWVAGQNRWVLAGRLYPDGVWNVFPRTPLERRLPVPRTPDDVSAANPEDALRYFLQLAESPDPLARAGALCAAAGVQQQLGEPVAAASTLADAAHILRTSPGLERFALRPELSRVEALLAAGERAAARTAWGEVVERLQADHRARISSAEVVRLRELARTFDVGAADPVAMQLGELDQRAHERWAFATAAAARLRERLGEVGAFQYPNEILITSVDEPLVVGVRRLRAEGYLALVAPIADIVRQYWQTPSVDPRWRVRLLSAGGSDQVLAQLGREFAHAVLEPSPQAKERLQTVARRRIGLVAVTAAGSAGAWALVIWVLSRVIARQRELVKLQRRFVADVSHELKTPLALIRLLAETLANQRLRDPERMQNYLETITRESERLSFLLDSILDFSRMESGRKEYHIGECDLAAVARQAWALFEPQFTSSGFDARLELAEDLPKIRADGQALQQVLVNLLQNAHRYAGDGKFVRLSITREGYLIVIAVEDHGIGMSRKQLERLGDSFVRGDDTRVRKVRGAGLGLAIVDHIIAAHHGKLEVQSRPGQGSTFTVWIPYQPPQPELA